MSGHRRTERVFLKKRYSQNVKSAALKALSLINRAQLERKNLKAAVSAELPAETPSAQTLKTEKSARKTDSEALEKKTFEGKTTVKTPRIAIKKEVKPVNDIENRENMVDALAAQGKTEDAVKLLLELIKEEAERKNFAKAEELRDKLYEVDAMALAEIVKASDIIEEARAGAVDQDYLQLWPDVFGSLSTEETNSIYFALEEKTVDTNQAVFTQGDHDTNLYFVTHGKLKIVHMQESKETLIKTIQPGDIAGIDTFFSISVCTTSMIALSASKLQVLKRDALAVWSAKHPNLEGKLEEHCLNREKISDLLFQKSIERRVHKRIKAAGPVGVHILNSAQKPIGKSFRGNAYDISVAGFCFYFKTPKQETARMLLGRNLHIQYVYSSGGEQKKIERIGRAIGVSYHLFNDYAIHMKFHQRVDVTTILEIEKLKMENK